MRRSLVVVAAATLPLVVTLSTWQAWARFRDEAPSPPTFRLDPGPPVGGAAPATPSAAYLSGSRIAALPDGALVIDADSGDLVRTDAAGAPTSHLAIGRDAGVLAYDPVAAIAYVADRRGDRIVAVHVGGTELTAAASWRTPAEPYGVALAPDRKTLLVTTVADRTLVAYDVSPTIAAGATTRERWRVALAREPRGVGVSPDGTHALVAHLGAGVVDDVDLQHAHDVSQRALTTGAVRGSFAVQFLGPREVVVPFQRSVPVNRDNGEGRDSDSGHYGGTSFAPPVTHHLAFLSLAGARTAGLTAEIGDQQPRALAWDAAHDALYVAGMGTDTLLQIRNASQIDVAEGASATLTVDRERCGPDGVAIADHGDVLVWCAFSRRVERLAALDDRDKLVTKLARAAGPALAPTALTVAQHDGMVVFHTADRRVSMAGGVACASCHVEGRPAGLSWSIENHELQTPMLAGRLVGTAPFKWDGNAPDLKGSLGATVQRLGGTGLTSMQATGLVAYLEQMPTVRAPTRPHDAVARGKALFESAELGCASCHDGAAYTDQSKHRLAGSLALVDTPSLLGLAASAPYFHDGSAPTLEALLRDRGGVHGMADDATRLDDAQVADLAAFLDTL